jgi:hypothetical protein
MLTLPSQISRWQLQRMDLCKKKQVTCNRNHNIYGGIPLDIEVGSKEDEKASQWFVVIFLGYEYDGSPEILREIFAATAFSVTDLISEHGNSKNHAWFWI